MLVLSRTLGERIFIGEDITIVVARVNGGTVQLGIEAPEDVKVLREEVEANDL